MTWQEQARAFLPSGSNATDFLIADAIARGDRQEIFGAIAGTLARMVFERAMGGPHNATPDQFWNRFASGCRAFLAAYGAHRKEGE